MGDRLQKAKKGKRKETRTDARGTKAKEQWRTQAQKVTTHAQRLIKDAWIADKTSIRNSRDIPKLLQAAADEFGLPSDHFDILNANDYCDLFIQIVNSQNRLASLGPGLPQASLNTTIQHGQATPVLSPASTECDGQSEGRTEEGHDEEGKEEELVISPLEGEDGESFNVKLYPGPEVAKASYCQNPHSYIGKHILKRHRWKPDPDNTICLRWEHSDVSRQAPRIKSTKFHVIEKVSNDLAIGTEHDLTTESDDLDESEGSDGTSESEEDGEQDGSDEEEDAEDEDEVEISSSEEVEANDEDSEFEQASSDGSYELIVSSTPDKASDPDRGYKVAAKLICAVIDTVNDSSKSHTRFMDHPTSAGRPPTKYSSKSPATKGANPNPRKPTSKQSAPQPERSAKKKQVATQGSPIPSKRRNSALVSQYSDGSPPSPLSLHRKPKRKG